MNCQKKGRLGEELAVKYLLEKGYSVVEKNVRIGKLEIDIVATKNETYYFFEVKSNFGIDEGSPLLRIDSNKRNHLYRAAYGYANCIDYHGEIEVMGIAVEVDLKEKRAKIEMVPC